MTEGGNLSLTNSRRNRLLEERRNWRKNHPPGFIAKPVAAPDGTLELGKWECCVPGPPNTPWEGGLYKLYILFGDSYPYTPPSKIWSVVVCYAEMNTLFVMLRFFYRFCPPILHPNVYTSGSVCISLLQENGWRSSMQLKDILVSIQTLLAEPNINSPANAEAYKLYNENRAAYDERIRALAKTYAAANNTINE
ncbi:SUMO-conjugating enzyme UBC9 [Trichinella pseudospiralis]|uniref:SUMO-conjugating enzyme UBC9 n=2 Tax=Trichinella pseudospiralis TaxID=6337 RepID=A0A0V1FNL4_TRIPS|nr:SUMO-conjugating enzyme UBC9 [Trichinella pseudospiralis]KRZ08042.1 SUMO-conjugating enzyme UBC9 [Trichinella pseudospiralis]KRZ37524.1 SUMO-conjugating enzyme UBC9 [Trichinella pseudospiralis]